MKKSGDDSKFSNSYLHSQIKILNDKIDQQNTIIKKLSSLIISLSRSELDISKVQELIDHEISEKVSLLNNNLNKLLNKLNNNFDTKLKMLNEQNNKSLVNLKNLISNQSVKKSKNFDNKIDLLNMSDSDFNAVNFDSIDGLAMGDDVFLDNFEDISNRLNTNSKNSIQKNNNDSMTHFDAYQSIKKEIISEIYKELYINNIKTNNEQNTSNNNYGGLNVDLSSNRLDLEFKRKLKRNKKEIIKQKMLEIISNKKVSVPELKEEIVDYNRYCSKASFYRYYNDLKSKNVVVESNDSTSKTYLSTPSILQRYEKNN